MLINGLRSDILAALTSRLNVDGSQQRTGQRAPPSLIFDSRWFEAPMPPLGPFYLRDSVVLARSDVRVRRHRPRSILTKTKN